MEISEGVIRRGRNTLRDLHNSLQDTQPHSLIVNYNRLLIQLFARECNNKRYLFKRETLRTRLRCYLAASRQVQLYIRFLSVVYAISEHLHTGTVNCSPILTQRALRVSTKHFCPFQLSIADCLFPLVNATLALLEV